MGYIVFTSKPPYDFEKSPRYIGIADSLEKMIKFRLENKVKSRFSTSTYETKEEAAKFYDLLIRDNASTPMGFPYNSLGFIK